MTQHVVFTMVHRRPGEVPLVEELPTAEDVQSFLCGHARWSDGTPGPAIELQGINFRPWIDTLSSERCLPPFRCASNVDPPCMSAVVPVHVKPLSSACTADAWAYSSSSFRFSTGIVHSKLSLQSAIGHASLGLEYGENLPDDLVEIHSRLSRMRSSSVGLKSHKPGRCTPRTTPAEMR